MEITQLKIQELRKELSKVSAFVSKNEKLFYLKHRWEDEKEYEDFSEYKSIISKIFLPITKDIKITKGFQITLRLKENIQITVKINKTHWKINAKKGAR